MRSLATCLLLGVIILGCTQTKSASSSTKKISQVSEASLIGTWSNCSVNNPGPGDYQPTATKTVLEIKSLTALTITHSHFNDQNCSQPYSKVEADAAIAEYLADCGDLCGSEDGDGIGAYRDSVTAFLTPTMVRDPGSMSVKNGIVYAYDRYFLSLRMENDQLAIARGCKYVDNDDYFAWDASDGKEENCGNKEGGVTAEAPATNFSNVLLYSKNH